MNRKSGSQLRFTAGLESEMKRAPCIDDFLDDFTELIDLDRENTAINILITKLSNGGSKSFVNRPHPMPKKILKPDHHREH